MSREKAMLDLMAFIADLIIHYGNLYPELEVLKMKAFNLSYSLQFPNSTQLYHTSYELARLTVAFCDANKEFCRAHGLEEKVMEVIRKIIGI